jgi:hypothetical protein
MTQQTIGVIFSVKDLEKWRADLATAKEALLAVQRNYRGLEKKLEAAEFLFRKMRSDQMDAGRKPGKPVL